MATQDGFPIKVDTAIYGSVALVLQTLKPCVLRAVKSFEQISGKNRCTEGKHCKNVFMLVCLFIINF